MITYEKWSTTHACRNFHLTFQTKQQNKKLSRAWWSGSLKLYQTWRREANTKESNWRATSGDVIPPRLFIKGLHHVTCVPSLEWADKKWTLWLARRQTRLVCLECKQWHHESISTFFSHNHELNVMLKCPHTVFIIHILKRKWSKASFICLFKTGSDLVLYWDT